MSVGIFWVCAMECMCAQTRPQFILSSKRIFWRNGVGTLVSNGKNPLFRKFSSGEDQTHNAAYSRTAIPTHYQWAIPAPTKTFVKGDYVGEITAKKSCGKDCLLLLLLLLLVVFVVVVFFAVSQYDLLVQVASNASWGVLCGRFFSAALLCVKVCSVSVYVRVCMFKQSTCCKWVLQNGEKTAAFPSSKIKFAFCSFYIWSKCKILFFAPSDNMWM